METSLRKKQLSMTNGHWPMFKKELNYQWAIINDQSSLKTLITMVNTQIATIN